MSKIPTIAIIGAGASGLMCADYLAQFKANIYIYEQMPSAGRKILWAGKTGLNLSHIEPIDDFVQRYDPQCWLEPYIREFDAKWIEQWVNTLGVETYIGSTGRLFPVSMKASPLLRAWLNRLSEQQVKIFYQHCCQHINQNTIQLKNIKTQEEITQTFDAIVLACGGLSYPQLGSTGEWRSWLNQQEITPMYASNVGVCCTWSAFMQKYWGQALKRIMVKIPSSKYQRQGDVIITHYGLESGVIYQLNHDLRQMAMQTGEMALQIDLLPDMTHEKLHQQVSRYHSRKMSLNTLWQKIGLDKVKIALLRECTQQKDWSNHSKMIDYIKNLTIQFTGFRPIDEAISSGGGVKQSALTENFQLKSNPYVFCTGEMLDWDAPTGGYLLTACFATGRVCGRGVAHVLNLTYK